MGPNGHIDAPDSTGRFTFLINGNTQGEPWASRGAGRDWTNHMIRNVEIAQGDERRIDGHGKAARLDYVQLNPPGAIPASPAKAPRQATMTDQKRAKP